MLHVHSSRHGQEINSSHSYSQFTAKIKNYKSFMMMRMMMLACRTNIILKDNLAMLNLVNNTEANTSCRIKEGNIIAGIFVSGYQGNDSENDFLLECLAQELPMKDD